MFFFNNANFNPDLRKKISNFFLGAGLVIYLFPSFLAFCFVIIGIILSSTQATNFVLKALSRGIRK